jgi:hypothetical protein
MVEELSVRLVVGLLLLFAVAIGGPQLLFAHVSGWKRLAKSYRATRPFRGERWRESYVGMSCASSWWPMRGVEYDTVLAIGADTSGVHLSARMLGHAALFVPWSELTVKEEASAFREWLFLSPVTCRIGFRADPAVELVGIGATLLDRLKTAAGREWPAKEEVIRST